LGIPLPSSTSPFPQPQVPRSIVWGIFNKSGSDRLGGSKQGNISHVGYWHAPGTEKAAKQTNSQTAVAKLCPQHVWRVPVLIKRILLGKSLRPRPTRFLEPRNWFMLLLWIYRQLQTRKTTSSISPCSKLIASISFLRHLSVCLRVFWFNLGWHFG